MILEYASNAKSDLEREIARRVIILYVSCDKLIEDAVERNEYLVPFIWLLLHIVDARQLKLKNEQDEKKYLVESSFIGGLNYKLSDVLNYVMSKISFDQQIQFAQMLRGTGSGQELYV